MTKDRRTRERAQAAVTSTILTEHATEIRKLGRRVMADIVEIGRRLSESRTILKDDGGWRSWLENDVKLSPQTAGRFIQVYEKRSKLEHLNLPVSGLYLLAAPSTTEAARTEIAERAKGGKAVKLADVKATVAKHRAPAKPSRERRRQEQDNREAWQAEWLAEGRSLKDYKAGVRDRNSEFWKWRSAKDETDKPETKLVWKRDAVGIKAETSGGYYRVYKNINLSGTGGNFKPWHASFSPNKGDRVKLGEYRTQQEVKTAAQAHHDEALGGKGEPPVTAAPAAETNDPEAATLVWKDENWLGQTLATTRKGHYSICKVGDEHYYTLSYCPLKGSRAPGQKHRTLETNIESVEAAKALAQADFEKYFAPALGEREPPVTAAAATAEPASELTRSEILQADRWWAVLLADNDIENARKIHALLVDDERRTAFIETLGKAINAVEVRTSHPEVLADVMSEALGVTVEEEASAPAVTGNGADPMVSGEAMKAAHARADEAAIEGDLKEFEETIGKWHVKYKKYPAGGWFWSACCAGKNALTNEGYLRATLEEARADARAAIEHKQGAAA